ncbi:Hypothetical protein CINCED_3A020116 [Cinara cedri]|uniref:Uncharacterized protein n=1 Tax=Cinara cedri TaxID=506608 RepID=A0A5E4LX33_9HEMI|nr:Hypothetical protein CINCED_3A020116 [Cinara cedri]
MFAGRVDRGAPPPTAAAQKADRRENRGRATNGDENSRSNQKSRAAESSGDGESDKALSDRRVHSGGNTVMQKEQRLVSTVQLFASEMLLRRSFETCNVKNLCRVSVRSCDRISAVKCLFLNVF